MTPWTPPDRPVLFGILFFGFMFVMSGFAFYSQETHVDKAMVRGAAIVPPECGWSATLVCDDDPSTECHWEKRWRCGYGLSWPNVTVRRPLAEDLIKERYP